MTRIIATGKPDPVLQHEDVTKLGQMARLVMDHIQKQNPEHYQLRLYKKVMNLVGYDFPYDILVTAYPNTSRQIQIDVSEGDLFSTLWTFGYYNDGKDVVGGRVFSEARGDSISDHEAEHQRSPAIAAILTSFIAQVLTSR